MNETVFRSVGILVELAKLFLVVCGVLEFKIKNKWATTITIVVAVGINSVVGIVIIGAYNFFSGAVCISIVAFSVCGKKKVIYGLLSYIIICMVDLLMTSIPISFMNMSWEQLHGNKFLTIGINSVSIIIFLSVIVIKLTCHKKISDIVQNVRTLHLVAIFVGFFMYLSFMTPLVLDASVITSTQNGKALFMFALGICVLIFVGSCIAFIASSNAKERLEEIIIIKDEIAKQKEIYDKTLFTKNEEIRRFRHDINNKIYCMHLLLREGKYEELESCFKQIDEEISDFEIEIQTGSELLNAIANNILKEYKNKGVIVNWKGRILDEINMSAVDLSTIFSNLLRNAFEAAALCDQEKRVDVVVVTLRTSLSVTIKNTFTSDLTIVNGAIKTGKSDKEKHGYGLQNVNHCVEARNGLIEYIQDGNLFIVELMLPNVLGIDF